MYLAASSLLTFWVPQTPRGTIPLREVNFSSSGILVFPSTQFFKFFCKLGETSLVAVAVYSGVTVGLGGSVAAGVEVRASVASAVEVALGARVGPGGLGTSPAVGGSIFGR